MSDNQTVEDASRNERNQTEGPRGDATPQEKAVVDTNVLMTVKDVAVYLQFAETTVYKLLNQGKLPGMKVGGRWRFSRKRLDKWLAERQVG